ncbi:MAG: hypothetical protein GWP91_19230 [Rhodobacterales bacterium]|nr:hypothetical protein [Rhodobacterales bacterium]
MVLALLLAVSAHAHKPAFEGEWDGPDNAYVIEDNEISIVIYRELTCEQPELWMTFDAVAGEPVWVQLGVPEIPRLEDDRPSVAVIGPGLPEPKPGDFPFEVPDGLGAVLLDGGGSQADFYEPFSQTSSWVHVEEWVDMPESGTSYIVGWNTENRTGKIWLAVGVVEDFSDVAPSDFGDWGPLVNNFHETGQFEPVPDIEEQVCEDNGADDDGHDHGEHDHGKEKGCDQTGGAPWTAGGLALIALVLRRRSDRA